MFTHVLLIRIFVFAHNSVTTNASYDRIHMTFYRNCKQLNRTEQLVVVDVFKCRSGA